MDALKEWIPPAKGYLPYYMFFLSLVAVGNSFQNYLTLHFTRRLYDGQFVPNTSLPPKSGKYDPEDDIKKLVRASSSSAAGAKGGRPTDQVTPLAARLFATYTLVIAIVRIYASYHLDMAPMYDLGIWTYVVALGHYASEYFCYGSTGFGLPQVFPFSFASMGIIWMLSQRSFYVES